jgi:omega-hydroxy-beta-dihydromenaquinone-9 sulfotransferase
MPVAGGGKSLTWREALRYRIGFVGFVRFGSMLRQLRHLRSIRPRYAPRLLPLLATSLAITPLCWWERARFGRQVGRVRMAHPPVFIIGHWRSGTTHLHNLMSRDRSFGWLSMYQALAPECSRVGGSWLKKLLARIVPAERPMDAMAWPMDAPQEDEIALAKMIPYSFYGWFVWPQRAAAMLDRYVLMNCASPAMLTEFAGAYRRLLQIATLEAGGRQLLLKNPVNTARVRLLLELFPDAKFIHIHRSPYDVYVSTVHLYEQMLRALALQEVVPGFEREAALAIYEKVMRRFFEDRALIPPGNLAELSYEALVRDPEGELRRIYETLGLSGYDAAAPAIRAYLASLRGYRKNRFALPDAERRLVEERWGFAFDALGYARTGDTLPVEAAG